MGFGTVCQRPSTRQRSATAFTVAPLGRGTTKTSLGRGKEKKINSSQAFFGFTPPKKNWKKVKKHAFFSGFWWNGEWEALEIFIFSLLGGSNFALGRGTVFWEVSLWATPPPRTPPFDQCAYSPGPHQHLLGAVPYHMLVVLYVPSHMPVFGFQE